MALSTRKKNIIKASWKAGEFKTPTALSKHFKIDPKTGRELVKGISQDNAQVVDALVDLVTAENSLKNSLKNPTEKAVVEKMVNDRLSEIELRNKIDDTTIQVLDGLSEFVKGGKKVELKTEGMGDGVSRVVEVEVGLGASDYKQAQDAIDKASVTLKVNERHAPKGDIAVMNNMNIIKPTF